VDGNLVLHVSGGPGNDTLGAVVQIPNLSTGTYDVRLDANAGNDTGILAVHDHRQTRSQDDLFRLDGGRGDRDRLFGTPNTEVLNGELLIDRPFEELEELLELFDRI
jgi:hypothetical protein